ncbi:SIMPL domain-containing protein [Chloroflexi bacterium TSY]|nr:SIMPL domain-containing protein [Chloroflexi bacterium TSY]
MNTTAKWSIITAVLISVIAFGAAMVPHSRQVEAAAQNANRLQQDNNGTITILGHGDVVAPADTAVVRLNTGGSPGFYGPNGPEFEPIEQENLDLIAQMLEENGIPADSISTNAFGRSDFGSSSNSGEVHFTHSEPDQLSVFMAELVEALQEERGPKIRGASAVFMVEDCSELESEAMQAALTDARRRAEMMADQMDVTLGQLVEIEEGLGDSAIFGAFGSGSCASIETAIHQVGFGGPRSGANSADEVEVSIKIRATFNVQ